MVVLRPADSLATIFVSLGRWDCYTKYIINSSQNLCEDIVMLTIYGNISIKGEGIKLEMRVTDDLLQIID